MGAVLDCGSVGVIYLAFAAYVKYRTRTSVLEQPPCDKTR